VREAPDERKRSSGHVSGSAYAKTEPDFYEGPSKASGNWRAQPGSIELHDLPRASCITGFKKESGARCGQDLCNGGLDKNAETREVLRFASGQGYGMNPFWGWSSLAYSMPHGIETRPRSTDMTARARRSSRRAGDQVCGRGRSCPLYGLFSG